MTRVLRTKIQKFYLKCGRDLEILLKTRKRSQVVVWGNILQLNSSGNYKAGKFYPRKRYFISDKYTAKPGN
jgi:hypothetical protein